MLYFKLLIMKIIKIFLSNSINSYLQTDKTPDTANNKTKVVIRMFSMMMGSNHSGTACVLKPN